MMSRQNWTIFEKGDTNMLLEVYVIIYPIKYYYFDLIYSNLDITMC